MVPARDTQKNAGCMYANMSGEANSGQLSLALSLVVTSPPVALSLSLRCCCYCCRVNLETGLMTLLERQRAACISNKREKERRSCTWKTVTPITSFPPLRHRLLLLLPPLAASRRRMKSAASMAVVDHSTTMITRVTKQRLRR